MTISKALGRAACAGVLTVALALTAAAETAKIETANLRAEADSSSGAYSIVAPFGRVHARIAGKVDGTWLHSDDYPQHQTSVTDFSDTIGGGRELTISNSGLTGKPDLVCSLRLYSKPEFAVVELRVENRTDHVVNVQALRVLEGIGDAPLDLAGTPAADRVLSDSFSEDRPNMKIHDLADAKNGMHRAVGSQLVYNRDSRRSMLLAALTSERWLTVIRLRVNAGADKVTGYEVDSTGTTELTRENSLREAPREDLIELSLPVAPGQRLGSERVLVSFGDDYHKQLEAYGALIRQLHHARVSAQTPIGWWSWTAYYFGLNQATALTNAEFLSQNLKNAGYSFFHIDEGYQYARGEYSTANARLFPGGMDKLERRVLGLGLTPGIWTAPFEVSERSWVYQNHKDWLVHNAKNQPIHAGYVIDDPESKKQLDHLFVLDTSHPEAQQYLRKTYTTLARDWGIRYIKLDFMEDSDVEGVHFRPNTTALEAQRIGLAVIREAVGEDVLLDKDGSPMLNPVGIVDTGRISCDTAHTFDASREAAPGIAARYYMNRNFFIGDPDAFTVSRQRLLEEGWPKDKGPLTLAEAQVSIALAAVAGGMYENGDDLPTIYLDRERMGLLTNLDLLNLARYGHAATPLDLMEYSPADGMPSTFFLRESKRQAILAVFNWTEKPRQRHWSFAELGMPIAGHSQVHDVLGTEVLADDAGGISLELAPHSVRVLKIIDTAVPAAAPTVNAQIPPKVSTGEPARFTVESAADGVPAVRYRWDFGDGTTAEGASVSHAFTHAGDFQVHLAVEGIEGPAFEKTYAVSAVGEIDIDFHPDLNQRYSPQP